LQISSGKFLRKIGKIGKRVYHSYSKGDVYSMRRHSYTLSTNEL